ncbi:DUF1642 domain-containing protein [Listeria booriae]|uniref:DUF1642 domain-containing protein n=1 Tax=Listeria booriae TaxID=1552123 RepID=A0A842CUB8_9LIST|nr:hypothetical protein [Listeria booriae]MBC2004666.1 DUF1642 domain-containing protein [Listeria booriae]
MKTSEFKQAIEEMGFITTNERDHVFVYLNKSHKDIEWSAASVRVDRIFGFKMFIKHDVKISEEKKRNLAELLFEYASTPLDEREEPKLYYVKCPVTGQYLNKSEGENKAFWWSNAYGNESNKFTREEIESFARKRDYLIDEEVTE